MRQKNTKSTIKQKVCNTFKLLQERLRLRLRLRGKLNALRKFEISELEQRNTLDVLNLRVSVMMIILRWPSLKAAGTY